MQPKWHVPSWTHVISTQAKWHVRETVMQSRERRQVREGVHVVMGTSQDAGIVHTHAEAWNLI